MNQIKGLFLATLLGSCSLAQAATLSFPEELVPLQVNGEKVEHSLFSKKLDFNLHQNSKTYSDSAFSDHKFENLLINSHKINPIFQRKSNSKNLHSSLEQYD